MISTEKMAAALDKYRCSVANSQSSEDREDFARLIAITENLLSAIQTGDLTKAGELVLAFSRQVSDSYAMQPEAFKPLADEVQRMKTEFFFGW